jgi:hypothetical protein
MCRVNPLITAATGLLGVMVGVAGKYLADLQSGRSARLLDEKLKHAIRFFEAADRARRVQQGVATAGISYDNAASAGDLHSQTIEHFREQLRDSQERARLAYMEAEAAHTAVRLLIPQAARPTRDYLDLCHEAWQPDEKKQSRERSLQEAEEAIRRAIGA